MVYAIQYLKGIEAHGTTVTLVLSTLDGLRPSVPERDRGTWATVTLVLSTLDGLRPLVPERDRGTWDDRYLFIITQACRCCYDIDPLEDDAHTDP